MLRRSLTIGALLALCHLVGSGQAGAASGQVTLPLAHRLQAIVVDLYRPQLLFGKKKISRGFVATEDGLIVAPIFGLEKVEVGMELKVAWGDDRAADGWLVWKDREVGFAIVRLTEPMPLFPAMGWRKDGGPGEGDALFAPGPATGGRPTLSRVVVAERSGWTFPSGRRLERVFLVTPALGAGPLKSPLVDEEGKLAALVSTLPAPAGSPPETVVAVPIGAIWPDIVAARSIRRPTPNLPPPAPARPAYRIGIGIGSGGITPRVGIGLGGVGGLSSGRGGWGGSDDPRLRHQQESEDRAKTRALEQALERREAGGPSASSPPPSTTGSLTSDRKAGSTAVSTSTGRVRNLTTGTYRSQTPSISSTWNPAGPPLTAPPSSKEPNRWPVVIEPVAPTPVERKRRSLEEMEAEIAAIRARQDALQRELDALRQNPAGRQ